MNPAKVDRSRVVKLTDLPNIGAACAKDLERIGIRGPEALRGRSAWRLYDKLCETTGFRHDPCMLDTFISVVRFMDGEAPKPWWAYTEERKKTLRENPKKSKYA